MFVTYKKSPIKPHNPKPYSIPVKTVSPTRNNISPRYKKVAPASKGPIVVRQSIEVKKSSEVKKESVVIPKKASPVRETPKVKKTMSPVR
jgi:hypothetical protein